MLGFLCNLKEEGCEYAARFVPTSSSCPPHADHRDWRALDARHGRVLLCTMPWGYGLSVWDPATDERRELPRVPLHGRFSWNAAVLCAAHGACDHLDCHHGPFLVVFVDSDTERLRVHVYSSEAGAWSKPTCGPPSPTYGVLMVPSALVGSAFYFLIDATNSILKYELATRNMSVIQLPPDFSVDFAVLMAMGDGGLGFARLENSRLFLWSMETGPKGDAEWAQTRVIQLETLLPVDASSISYDFVGFAHGVGVFFVGTDDGLFSIDLKSGRVMKVCEEECGEEGIHGVIPYISFYTPDFHQYGLVPV
uniref:F-box protein AT5G49610-like beta-propeller domain-containing protein n=2 Tax=Arundo donax TaxID=35708 RepID=A0A0A8Y5Z5_ARUDO